MKKYNVKAQVTISVSQTVKANNEEEALEIARELELPQLCIQCSGGPNYSSDDEWIVGELDGAPVEIALDK